MIEAWFEQLPIAVQCLIGFIVSLVLSLILYYLWKIVKCGKGICVYE